MHSPGSGHNFRPVHSPDSGRNFRLAHSPDSDHKFRSVHNRDPAHNSENTAAYRARQNDDRIFPAVPVLAADGAFSAPLP